MAHQRPPDVASDDAEPSAAALPPEPSTPEVALPLLTDPLGGIPHVIETERDLQAAAEAIAGGEGSVALDAERASGYRYSQRAYLVQVRREGAGSFLIDPIACPDLSPINDAIGGAEWILHAATQDLACLAEVGLHPRQLFDTELAARILGLPRVGLSAVVEHYLGVTLAKEHSAVDWSTRPLPEPWLRYAALDVEVLGELRNLMGVDLAMSGKSEWARQEFDSLLTWAPTEKAEPWRRLHGLAALRGRRGYAVARELWYARDAIARDRDIAAGRIANDRILIEIAEKAPTSVEELPAGHRPIARYGRQWVRAVRVGLDLAEADLPLRTVRSEGPPPARSWADRDPEAAARLSNVRAALGAISEEKHIPVENLCSPEPLRRVIWTPPATHDETAFREALAAQGVRPWQQDIVAPILASAFAA
ncbi:MAG TPA: HRDC domain-containing protein [Phycicoccus sp.]|jgi:ribonuclease D|nr:HRDC domain-containing protein [Phycicoccus sp.]HQK31015.1 HRDC domain-containing protein [Phycicoccus sp.]